jgi:hypothetical protein
MTSFSIEFTYHNISECRPVSGIMRCTTRSRAGTVSERAV